MDCMKQLEEPRIELVWIDALITGQQNRTAYIMIKRWLIGPRCPQRIIHVHHGDNPPCQRRVCEPRRTVNNCICAFCSVDILQGYSLSADRRNIPGVGAYALPLWRRGIKGDFCKITGLSLIFLWQTLKTQRYGNTIEIGPYPHILPGGDTTIHSMIDIHPNRCNPTNYCGVARPVSPDSSTRCVCVKIVF